ncbi:MAG: sulfotransferase [Opitutaceae bacterium]
MRRKALKWLRHLPQKYFVDLPRSKETVFLASSGRSGSTWLQELLTNSGDYRILFEPFCCDEVAQFSDWEHRQYINRDSAGASYRDAAAALLDGKLRGPWIDQDNRALFPRKRFIKDIRANLFIAWLKQQFPQLQVIFLMRHPFSVAVSRIHLGWSVDLEVYFSQEPLMQQHFTGDAAFLRSIQTEFGRQVAFWAIENVVALRELANGDALVVSYEDFIRNPLCEFNRILAYLNQPVLTSAECGFAQRSRSTDFIKTNEYRLSDRDIEEGLLILDRFKLTQIYTDDIERAPEISKRDILREFNYTAAHHFF